MQRFWNAVKRRKRVIDNGSSESQLARVLNVFDLTFLGVGSTLGLGVYLLAGSVAYEQAGPSVTISFLVAALASAMAGMCYAEFASRVPKAGSAYVYSYITVGEFVAFSIGWNLILEYGIGESAEYISGDQQMMVHFAGASSVARGLSNYIDALMDNRMKEFLRATMPINVGFLGQYPDWLAWIVILVLNAVIAFGVKESTFVNNICTTFNLATICVVIVAGGIAANPANWSIAKESIPAGVRGGEGGFMPYGIAGIMAGAAKCFFGFVGFDVVATTGEEAINPLRNIPLAIAISLSIIFAAYFGVSTVITMLVPYYEQDPGAPLPYAFGAVGMFEIKWIVTIGAIFALCTTMLGALFPLPRIIYAMASDGLLFKGLSRINGRTKTPLVASVFAGLLSSTMALIFDLNQLIEMLSIGTLLAYTIVAISVLVLRYQYDLGSAITEDDSPQTDAKAILGQLLNVRRLQQPTQLTSNIVKIAIVLFGLSAILLCIGITVVDSIPVVGCAVVLLLAMLLVTVRQPSAEKVALFNVPLVPWIPCVSVTINLYLMFQLSSVTWIRFAGWGAIGEHKEFVMQNM